MPFHIASAFHALEFAKTGAEVVLGPGTQAARASRSFLMAASTAKREARCLHDEVNHPVRNFVVAAHNIEADPLKPIPLKIAEIREEATQCLSRISDQVAATMTTRVRADVSVSVGTVSDTKKIQRDAEFDKQVEKEEARLPPAGTPTLRRARALRKMAEDAGGTGEELAPEYESSHETVTTRIRSDESETRFTSRARFWLIEKSSAHRYFQGECPEAKYPIYCPSYDLMPVEHRNRHARRRHAEECFSCPRKEWWKHYRSVAVVPLRTRPLENRTGFIGYLWLDSLKPRVFNDCFSHGPEGQSTWSAALHFVHAVADAISTVLATELALCDGLTGAVAVPEGAPALPGTFSAIPTASMPLQPASNGREPA